MATKVRAVALGEALAWAGVASIAAMALGASPATAVPGGSGTVIRGSAFPSGTGIAHTGCDNPFGAGAGPATPYVALGPGSAPAGQRSLGFDLAGGSAAGPVAYTGSLAADGVASVAVYAEQGTTGVAWVGLRDADDAEGLVWFGRASIGVGGGGWSRVSTSGLTLVWAQYDVATGARVADGPTGSVESMLAEHGDGPGMVALTLGCDGAPFFLDAWQVGARSYDFEGLQTAMHMRGVDQSLVAGESTTIRGDFGLTGTGRVPHATAILEKQTDGAWETVRVVDAGVGGFVDSEVEPPKRTSYRWRFVDRPLAEGSTSAVIVVDVAFAVDATVEAAAVTGHVSPGIPGVAVTLRRAGFDDVVATGTTSGGGAYSLATQGVPDGAYVVRAAATTMNQQGQSTPVQVTAAPADPAATPTPTPTPSASPSAEPTPQPSDTASSSPSDTASPSPSDTASPSPSPTPSRPPEPTPSPTVSATPSAQPSGPGPSPSPSPTPAAASAPVDPSTGPPEPSRAADSSTPAVSTGPAS